jgi:hypothetical protein
MKPAEGGLLEKQGNISNRNVTTKAIQVIIQLI